MWTDHDLNGAQYVAFFEDESKQPLNVGTIEVPSLGQGPYLMTPAPPFGSLNGGDLIQGLRNCVKFHPDKLSIQYGPRTWPTPINGNDAGAIWHQYGDGTV